MMKRIVKYIRCWLLKVDWIKLEVEAYKLVQKKKRHHERWAQLMHSGQTVHDLEPKRQDPYDTLAIVTDDGVIVEYMNGRVVDQSYIDSTNWGVDNYGS